MLYTDEVSRSKSALKLLALHLSLKSMKNCLCYIYSEYEVIIMNVHPPSLCLKLFVQKPLKGKGGNKVSCMLELVQLARTTLIVQIIWCLIH